MKITVFVPILLVSCNSHPSENVQVKKPQVEPTTQLAQVAPKTRPYAFDVPYLLGQKIDSYSKLLGKPTEGNTPNLTVNEAERTYTRGGYRLAVTYNTRTEGVTGLLIMDNSGGKTKNCSKLLVAGNLKASGSSCKIDSLAGTEDGTYIGLIISKK